MVAADPSALQQGAAAPHTVGFRDALRFWLKLGCISFGGPTGQIAIMHRELVVQRRWISERRFLHALNYCMLLPGPEAQQLATYIGWLLHGVRGGIAAGALFVLPSLFVLLALAWLYLELGDIPIVAGALDGVKPAVVAIVLSAAWRIGSRTLTNPVLGAIAAAAFIALFFLRAPFPLVVLGAAAFGYAGGRIAPAKFVAGGHGAGEARSAATAALIDDHTPPPHHARIAWPGIARHAAIGLLLWVGTQGLLWWLFAWRGTFTQMGWFFSKAALLTFGGAYAVLPYVQQAAVDRFGWLTPAQMIDGLALGETTPGPLIMVVTFVGFVGGWTQAPLGPDALVPAGLIGGLVATWFTFLPSFLFILMGAPLVEATRGDIKLTAPLTAITAAVVGVILNLALYFAAHVLWPGGVEAAADPRSLLLGFDWFAALIGLAAFIALRRYETAVISVIASCAVVGLLRGSL